MNFIIPEDIFSYEELKYFFKIKHEVIFNDNYLKIIKIKRELKYFLKSDITIYHFKEDIPKDLEDKYLKHLDKADNFDNKKGIFIPIKNSEFDLLIRELYFEDKNYGEQIFQKYLNICAKEYYYYDSEEVMELLLKIKEIKEDILNNNKQIKNYNIGTNSLLKINNTEKIFKAITQLTKNKNINNNSSDLNFKTTILDNCYSIINYNDNTIYIFKEIEEYFNIYCIKREDNFLKPITENIKLINDFLYYSEQDLYLFKNNLEDYNLIGQIKNNYLIKSSYQIDLFFEINTLIYNELKNK